MRILKLWCVLVRDRDNLTDREKEIASQLFPALKQLSDDELKLLGTKYYTNDFYENVPFCKPKKDMEVAAIYGTTLPKIRLKLRKARVNLMREIEKANDEPFV